MQVNPKIGAGCGVLFSLPFVAIGLVTVFLAIRRFTEGKWGEGGFLLIFTLVFGGVGSAILFAIVRGYQKQKELGKTKERFPNQPWLWRDDWCGGRITYSSKSVMSLAWMIAVFWNLISCPTLVFVPREVMESKNYPALLALIFPVVGVGLLIWAVRTTIQWKKFGTSVFEMADFPGAIGGTLAGIIHTDIRIQPENGFQVKLSCIHRTVTGSGDNQSVNEDVVWEKEQSLMRELGDDHSVRSAIPVYFEIPYSCVESSPQVSDDCILWRLTTEAQVRGVDYSASFEVPVFKVERSSEKPVLGKNPLEAYQARALSPRSAEAMGVVQRPNVSGGTEFEFSAMRGVIAAMIPLVCAGGGGVVAFLLYRPNIPVIVPIGIVLFSLLFLWSGIWYSIQVRKVVMASGGVILYHSFFGWGWTRIIPVSDIQKIESFRGMQIGSGLYYDLYFVLRSGKHVPAGRHIKGKSRAEEVVTEMSKFITI